MINKGGGKPIRQLGTSPRGPRRLDLKKEKPNDDVGKRISKNWIWNHRFAFVFYVFMHSNRYFLLASIFLLILFPRHCVPMRILLAAGYHELWKLHQTIRYSHQKRRKKGRSERLKKMKFRDLPDPQCPGRVIQEKVCQSGRRPALPKHLEPVFQEVCDTNKHNSFRKTIFKIWI